MAKRPHSPHNRPAQRHAFTPANRPYHLIHNQYVQRVAAILGNAIVAHQPNPTYGGSYAIATLADPGIGDDLQVARFAGTANSYWNALTSAIGAMPTTSAAKIFP